MKFPCLITNHYKTTLLWVATFIVVYCCSACGTLSQSLLQLRCKVNLSKIIVYFSGFVFVQFWFNTKKKQFKYFDELTQSNLFKIELTIPKSLINNWIATKSLRMGASEVRSKVWDWWVGSIQDPGYRGVCTAWPLEARKSLFSRLALAVWWVITTCLNSSGKIQNGVPANS